MYYKACTKPSQYYFVLQSLHKHVPVLLCTAKLAQNIPNKVVPSTTVYYKACTKHSQYYCVLQSLHEALPSTTVYYKACTNMFQYYCILQSLHKALPSTTVYYKLQSLHKTFPVLLYTTNSHKHVPVLLCTTKITRDGRAKRLMDRKVLDLSHSFSRFL